jgi:hypothetical protein
MKSLDAVIVLAGSIYAETLQNSAINEKPTPIIFADGVFCQDWGSYQSQVRVIAGLKNKVSETSLRNNRERKLSLQELCEATGAWEIYN